MLTYETFALATEAKKKSQKVNGVLMPDGRPRYWLSGKLTDEEATDQAFHVKYGRPRTDVERNLYDLAKIQAASDA